MKLKHILKQTYIILLAKVRIIKAKLAMPKDVDEYYRKSFNMRAAQVANEEGYFDVPFSRLDIWEDENKALDKALDDITNKIKGGQAAKTRAMADLDITLRMALNYVNDLCFVNQEKAYIIINTALMEPTIPPIVNKLDFRVEQTPESGSIKLIAIGARINGKRVRASYEWEDSTNNGITWDKIATSIQSTYIAKNRQIGIVTLFRRRVTTKTGTTAWVVSKPITPA